MSPARTLERINYISSVYNELTSRATPTPFRREQQAVVEPRRAVQSELVRNTCSKASEIGELTSRAPSFRERQVTAESRAVRVRSELVRNVSSKASKSKIDELVRRVHVLIVLLV